MQAVITYYKNVTRWDVKSFLLTNTIGASHARLSSLLKKRQSQWNGTDNFPMLSLHFGGVFSQRESNQIKGKLFVANKGNLVYSKIDLRNGAIGIIPNSFPHALFTAEFPIYEIDTDLINPIYLQLYLQSVVFKNLINSIVRGASGRKRVKPSDFEDLFVYVPSFDIQEKIVSDWRKAQKEAQELSKQVDEKEKAIIDYILGELGVKKKEYEKKKGGFVTWFRDLERWSLNYLQFKEEFYTTRYENITLKSDEKFYSLLTRGKSPKYSNSNSFVLNQKCNRWNYIETEFAKSVDEKWLSSINPELKTKTEDVLINSTGEGTIGRSSVIKQDMQDWFYDSHTLLLRLNQEKINSGYFVNVFNSPYIQRQIDIAKSAQSTQQTELGIENVENLKIPLPPLPKQKEIAKKVEGIRTEIARIKNKASSVLETTQKEIGKMLKA